MATDHQVLLADLLAGSIYYVQVMLTDKAGNTTTAKTRSFTTLNAPDLLSPEITNGPVAIGISHTQAGIDWRTDESATSLVRYSLLAADLATGLEVTDDRYRTEHQERLRDLTPATEYFYQVTSADAAGNTTTSEIKSFETRAAPDHVSPLVLSGPVVSGITQNECTIGWTTNEISTTVLEYGLDESYGSFWGDSATDVGHQVQLLDLIEDTTYFFRFYSTDASGNSSSPRVGTFHTLATPDVDAPVITSGPLATGITDHGAVVKWRSDEVADTHLRLSTTLDFAVTETDLDEALDFDHLVDIGNLLPYTTYFYEIQSTDGTGNASEVILRSFRTLAEPDLLAPAIVLGPVVTALSNTTAQIEWDSDEDAVASLTYLEEGLEVTLSSADLKRIHAVVLSGLLPATAYEYWITLADGSGNNSLSPHFGFTTLESPDTTSPAIIKGPFVSIVLHDQAVVEWQTDESSDSSVEYGLTTGAGESVAGADVVQEHMIRLTGLQPGSIYHYRVLSRDTNGNEPTVSAIHTFETLAAPDTVAPEITASAVVVERSDQSASIGWSTNELAAGFVEYGVGPEFGSVAVSADLVGEHLLRLTHLEPATQYHFRVGSTDLVGNGPTYGAANTFFTKSQPDLLPPVIEVQPFIAGLTQTTATIEWVSDEPSDSQVKYWITGSAEVTEKVLPEDVTSHSVVLGNLLPSTEYNLEISSTDAAGNGPTGGDAVLFTTPADADTIAPVILSGPTVTGITESSATVEWTTDEQSTTVLDHGTKRAYELGHTEDADRVTTHVVTLTGLSGNRTYHFRIESTDESGNTVDSDPGGTRQHNRDHKFKTLKAGDTDSPVFLEGPIVYAKARRATLLWRTDEAVNYELTYGTSASLDGPDAETREENHLRKRHSVSLARLVKGTSYFYRLRVRDRAGNETIAATPGAALPPGAAAKVLQAAGDGSFLTAETVDTQAPMLVSLPRLTATTQTTFTVEWETDEPSDSYISYGVEQPDEARHGSAFHLVEHRVTLTNLVAGVTYVFHTGSTDASGNGETVSPLAVATTDTELDLIPPSITSGPEIVYRSDDTVTLEWSTDEPSTSVVNYGQEGLDLLSELSDMSRVHNITLTNLIPSSEYVYQVSSTDASGNGPTASDNGTVQTADLPDYASPVIISGPTVTSTTDQTLTLTWSTDELSDSFVEWGASPTNLGTVVGRPEKVFDHIVKVTGLTPGTTYHYRVGSVDAANNAPTRSDVADVTIELLGDMVPPTAPKTVQVIAGSGAALLTWTESPEEDVAGYNVYRSTTSLSAKLVASALSAPEFLDKGLRNGESYSYTVTAVDQALPPNESLQSEAATASPSMQQAPGSPVGYEGAASASGGTLTVVNATAAGRKDLTYVFQVSSNVSFTDVVASAALVPEGTEKTRWSFSRDLQQDEQYWWRARADDGLFAGPWMEPNAVTVIGIVGDFNEDGRVGFDDFFQFADHFGLVEGAPSTGGRVWDATFDLNRDGAVGFDDFFIFADHFGEDSAAGKRSATWAMLAHEQLKPRLELAEIHRDKAVIALRLTADRPIRGVGVILSHAPDLIMSSASGKLTGSDVGRERLETVFRSPHPDQTVAASFYLHKAIPSNVEDQVLELSFDLSSDVMGTDVFLQSLQVIAADGSLYRADLANVHVTLVPQEYSLSEPFPNPFNPAVQIDYALPHAGEVEIVVYNILGQKVRTLLSNWQEAGFQRIAWHGLDDANRQMASGVYLIRVTTSGLLRTRKVVLIR